MTARGLIPMPDDDTLMAHWRAGDSMSAIGVKMNRSKSSIAGRVFRLTNAGLIETRGSPIPRSAEWAEATGKRRAVPVSVRLVTDRNSALKASRLVPLRVHIALSPSANSPHSPPRIAREPKYIPLGKCRYPMWGDNEPPTHQYCDAALKTRSYCKMHARRCYGWHRVEEAA